MRPACRLVLALCLALMLATSTAAAAPPTDRPNWADKIQRLLELWEKHMAEKKKAKPGTPAADVAPAATPGVPGIPVDLPSGTPPEAPAVTAPPVDLAAIAQGVPPVDPATTKLGETVGAATVAGGIRVKAPGADTFTQLPVGAPVPVGSVVDATEGLVQIAAEAAGGADQQAVLTGAVFKVQQAAKDKGVTDLVLRGGDFSDCGGGRGKATARAAGARKGKGGQVARGLWAAGKGKFRTKGRYGTAAVRGTRWATVDRCNSTTVKVFDGVVDVTDHATGETVAVRAGERRVIARPGAR